MPHLLGVETGSGNSARGWCEALVRQGLNVTALVDDRLISRSAPMGTRCFPVRHRFAGRTNIPTGLRALITSADLLVVHGGWTMRNVTACLDAVAVGVPYVVTTHGVYNEWVLDRGSTAKRTWNVLVERRHLRKALAIHLFYEQEMAGLKRLGVGTPSVIAPNGITAREDVRWDGGSGGYLLWLGRFDPVVKGLDILVRSLAQLPANTRPTLRLHGPDTQRGKAFVSSLVDNLRLERWVVLGDPIYGEEKWSTITRAAGCVYPSRWDTSPMAVAEAVGAGVPTLVADFPLGRTLAAEGAALMCERSPEGVAAGIERLLSSEGVEAGSRGVAVAAGRLSWDSVARSWLEQVSLLMDPQGPEQASGNREP